MNLKRFIDENKLAIFFTILVVLAGSVYYLTSGSGSFMTEGATKIPFLEDARFKVAFDSDNSMVLFVSTKNNALAGLRTMDGNPIPEENTMVLGSDQAALLKLQRKEFKYGSSVRNYFGINTTIEGILAKTNTLIDDFHFLSVREFEQVNGDNNRIFVRMLDGVPKPFYKLGLNEKLPQKLKFANGSMNGYAPHDLDGSIYYPLVLGSKEAKLLQKEKRFTSTGDSIRNLFGRNFIVSGILEETNTSADRMYFVPLDEIDIKQS